MRLIRLILGLGFKGAVTRIPLAASASRFVQLETSVEFSATITRQWLVHQIGPVASAGGHQYVEGDFEIHALVETTLAKLRG
jgi:hypothetical protein